MAEVVDSHTSSNQAVITMPVIDSFTVLLKDRFCSSVFQRHQQIIGFRLPNVAQIELRKHFVVVQSPPPLVILQPVSTSTIYWQGRRDLGGIFYVNFRPLIALRYFGAHTCENMQSIGEIDWRNQ
jgi:hypothetical protein